MKANIVLFGNCGASSLVLGYRANIDKFRDINMYYWAMSAQHFLEPFYNDTEDALVIFDKAKRDTPALDLNPENIKGGGDYEQAAPEDEKLLKLWVNGPKDFRVPVESDSSQEYIYCFCSPIMPNLTIDAMIRDYVTGKMVCSRRMLEDMLMGFMQHQMDFIEQAASRLNHFYVIEGPKRLRYDCDVSVHKKVDRIFRETMEKFILDRKASLLNLPKSVYNDDHFTHEQFRAYKERLSDTVHMNTEYGSVMFEALLDRLVDDKILESR